MEFTSPGSTTLSRPVADWRAWHQQYSSRLVLYARQWLPERADAEDAVQAGFVKFWKNKPSPCESDVPLLYATVRCAALDLIKVRRRREAREVASMADTGDCWWDVSTIEERERAEMMQRALQALPMEQREVVTLRVWADMTFAEIAETLGENLNTITARYRYALANLKKHLPEDCHERVGT
jgi:RNA polymerase sigma-70 factor (ECF subfamily)